MKTSSVAQTAFLLALTAETGNATRYTTTIKNFGVKFKINWWDDARNEPYRMAYTKNGVYSAYTFNSMGELQSITVEGEDQPFSTSRKLLATPEDIASRNLLAMNEDLDADEMDLQLGQDHHSRRLYDCSDCENTWDTMCGTGLADVCGVVAWGGLTGDAKSALKMFCAKFTKECNAASGEETCADDCAADIPEECDPTPCENDGGCSADPGGGHVCSCASGYGGMACQTDTSSLDSFYIEVEYEGTWTDARQAVFQTAADRWAEVITHVPCGGYGESYPAGRILITATLEYIDGVGGTLGSAGRRSYWTACPTISATGAMTFDIDDIDGMESDGTFEGAILHEMGHVIGVGSSTFAVGCSTCSSDGDPAWLCPSALSTYYDLGGTDADILELNGGTGTSCGHLDEGIFDDELMTGYVDSTMYLSKMTAALLEDLEYIVDPSEVDPYTLPSQRVVSISAEDGPSIFINDTAVPVMIHAINDDGTLVEVEDIVMVF